MTVDPLDVYCPFCSAARDTPCSDFMGNDVAPHNSRLRMANGADFASPGGTPMYHRAW